MKEIAVNEARARFSELLAAVEAGEQVVITRRGVPVARLVAAHSSVIGVEHRPREVSEVFASLRQARQGVSLDLPLRQATEGDRD